jgi:uncharacterized protein YukE
MPFAKFLKIGTIAAVLAAIFLSYTHAQGIEDWFKLRNYSPPPAIAALATEDSMTDYGRHIFYVNHPQLESNLAVFRQQCSQSEQTIVLGCYHGGQRGIEVYNVRDERLSGIQQVTAAHEMLHAAYDRLAPKDKDRINAMLLDFYNNQLSDQRIKDTIDSYKKTEPTELVNEMHSIFGTEVASLPAPLENYYKKYFIDRSKVTGFASIYETEFTSRINRINEADARLAELKMRIKNEEQDLQSQLVALQNDRSRVENSSSQAEVNNYNSRVAAYNAGVRQLQSDIASYNALVEERNQLAAELKSLQGSMDTRLTAQEAQ